MYSEYLVTGGAGALGKLIIGMLLEQGAKVRILMSEKADVSDYLDANLKICYGISTDKESMMDFFDLEDPRHSVLIHADEYISMSPESNLIMRRVNVTGAQNIVDMCLKRKVGRLVFLGSAYALDSSVKGEGVSIHFDRNKAEGDYAKTKAEAAAYILEKVALNRLNAVMVLPTFIIGPGYSQDYEINKILNSYLKGVHPVKGGGHAFVDVRDVANAMVALTEEGEPGSGYIISGEYKTSMEFFEKVNEVEGIDAPIKTASRFLMSRPLSKFVDAYYRRTHKDNPKHVYALFQDNQEKKYDGTGAMYMNDGNVDFSQSISDSIDFLKTGTMPELSMADIAADTAAGPAERGSATAAIVAARKASEAAKEAKAEEAKADDKKEEAEEEVKVNRFTASRTTFFTKGAAEGKVEIKKEEEKEESEEGKIPEDETVEEEVTEVVEEITEEAPAETVEDVVSEAEETAEEAVEETQAAEEIIAEAEENVEETVEEITEEIAEEVSVEETAEETVEEIIEEAEETAVSELTEEAEDAAGFVVEEAAEEAPEETVEDMAEEILEETSDEVKGEIDETIDEISDEVALEVDEETVIIDEEIEEAADVVSETEEVVEDAVEGTFEAEEITEVIEENADVTIDEETEEAVTENGEEEGSYLIEEVSDEIVIEEETEDTGSEDIEISPEEEVLEEISEGDTDPDTLPTMTRPIWETMPPIEDPDELLLDLDDLDNFGGEDKR